MSATLQIDAEVKCCVDDLERLVKAGLLHIAEQDCHGEYAYEIGIPEWRKMRANPKRRKYDYFMDDWQTRLHIDDAGTLHDIYLDEDHDSETAKFQCMSESAKYFKAFLGPLTLYTKDLLSARRGRHEDY